MRFALALALLLVAAAAPREGCGNGSTPPAYDACAGKACGDACTACPPGAADCLETAVVKACDAPCAWPDLPCLHATPPCLPPQGPGHCHASGACAQGYPLPAGACPASWGCVGKTCGDGCS